MSGLDLRPCGEADVAAMFAVINDGAQAYRGVIPEDRWHEPYMAEDELRGEIAAGVAFTGAEVPVTGEAGAGESGAELVGVMGLQ